MEKRGVSILSSCLITPLGLGTSETFEAIEAGISSVRSFDGRCMSLFTQKQWDLLDAELPDESDFSRFETLLFVAAKWAILEANINPKSGRLLFMVVSAHGNCFIKSQLGFSSERAELPFSAKSLCSYFENPNDPMVFSDMTISSYSAVKEAYKLLEEGIYDHIVVVAADVVPQAVAPNGGLEEELPCCLGGYKSQHQWVLGEAGAALVLSRYSGKGVGIRDVEVVTECNKMGEAANAIALLFGTTQHDTHLVDVVTPSAPSQASGVAELKQLQVVGVAGKPTILLKGYFGHTMGVEGLLEAAVGAQLLLHNTLVEAVGTDELTSIDANFQESTDRRFLKVCLKTMVDDEGRSAAILLAKN